MSLADRSGIFIASQRGAPLAVFFFGLLVGVTPSWSISLWTDEAVTISAAERSPAQLLGLLSNIDAVHGAYYFLMYGWVQLTGIGAVGLRFPSAVALAGTCVGVLFLVRRLATPSTAITASAVAALLPRLAWAGIEARPFIFSALAAVWSTWALVRAWQAGSKRLPWVAYTLLAIAAVFFNIYLVFLVAGHGVTLAVRRSPRRVWIGWAVSTAVTAAATLPFLALVRSQQSQLGTGGDRNPLSLLRKVLVNQLYLGETPNDAALPSLFGIAWQAAAILLGLSGAVIMALAILRPARPGDMKRELLAVALPWLALPTVAIALYAIIVAPVYQPRYFTFTAPAAAVLIALGLRSLRRRLAVVIGAICLIGCLIVLASQRTPFSKSGSDWSAAAAIVGEYAQPGDAVYFSPRYDASLVSLTARRIAEAYPGNFQGLTDLTLRKTGAETDSLDGVSVQLSEVQNELAGYAHIWMLYGDRYPQNVVADGKALIEEAGFDGSVRWSGPNVTVIEYTRRG
ncbi:hypothetical protein CVS47_00198 [Microbacterium lemovicicum]|uniref:Glycosyltransferase RgtA/B/C/D-like domain-containing protein n=1 Tax=Microbacterium lemovicicum TaxID=1072463 RepID=A0A3S9W690_9MICO|nr:hypothetical protein [Microbacterium lemovicicum]AZS35606.1 hypothetical protein CVS47_00198 [Microbacterium lemovicicum]